MTTNGEKSNVLIVWSRENGYVCLAARCGACGGEGRLYVNSVEADDCEHCEGRGWFGIDPQRAVMAEPGSVERIAMLSVRYASGVPLWNNQDRADDEHTVRRLRQNLLERNGREFPHLQLGGMSLTP